MPPNARSLSRSGLTVDRSALDHCWSAVTTADTVDDSPFPFELRGVSYVAWRDEQRRLIAVRDRCSHREAKLSLGTLDDGCLRCPYHGWVFDGDGRCVEIPSSGPGAAIPPTAHLRPLSIAEHYGLVWFCPAEPHRISPTSASSTTTSSPGSTHEPRSGTARSRE